MVSGASPKREQGPLLRTHHSPTSAGNDRGSQGFPHIRLAVCLTSVGGEGETEPGLHSADVDYESGKVHAVARTGWELSAHGEPRGVSLRVFAHNQEHDGACPSRPCSSGGPTLRSSPRQTTAR